MSDCSPLSSSKDLIKVAVASYEGVLVNQHLGMADSLLIFETGKEGCRLVDRRRTPPPGNGDERWKALSRLISDCRILLTSAAGEKPLAILAASGIKVYEVEGIIEDALIAISQGKELRMPHRTARCCRRAGSGLNGPGCG
jgi:nitrogen fixation protein NifB